MKIKTSELTGAALDWAAATCEFVPGTARSLIERKPYSISWQDAGPIIERERITLIACDNDFEAQSRTTPLACEEGPTPLIAAMRCYVASRLGDEVNVPDELC